MDKDIQSHTKPHTDRDTHTNTLQYRQESSSILSSIPPTRFVTRTKKKDTISWNHLRIWARKHIILPAQRTSFINDWVSLYMWVSFCVWCWLKWFCFPWEERNTSLLFAMKLKIRENYYTPQDYNQSNVTFICALTCSHCVCARREGFAVECRPTLETYSKLHVGIEIAGFGSFWGRQ